MVNTLPDLGAYVLKLRSLQSLKIENHMGRASQELALRILDQADPALAQSLHDSDELKPFTASGLLRAGSTRSAYDWVRPGESFWVRFTALEKGVVEAFERFAAQPRGEIEFDKRGWGVEAVVTDPEAHPWAGRAHFADLLRLPTQPMPSPKITLNFASPTSFRSKGVDVPLPIPWLVFHSLTERWQVSIPIPLPEGLLDFVEQFVALTRYQLETSMIGGKNASKRVGFWGEATFSLMADNDSLKKHDPVLHQTLSSRRPELLQALSALVRFAFFSGVGRQTTTGMGMCEAGAVTESQ
ncbi:hypothetical protein ANRL4_04500 [Anaerolineae bacterium]|nr:hypothetical protein ANRL4_04500 [Anaerolineae bacterium]